MPRGGVMTMVVMLVVVLVAACGGTSEPAADGRSPARDGSPPSATSPAASPVTSGDTFAGSLGGDAHLEGGCAWLETGSEGRVEPRWPDGYQVAFDPVRLLGPDGEVVAEDGDTVEVRGEIAADVMTTCQVGPVLRITRIVGS